MTLPSRTLQDVQQFTAFCKKDPSLSFQITAISELSAKVQALDKIGYAVWESPNGKFFLVDADDIDMVLEALDSDELVDAVNEAFDDIEWKLSEPTELIGGNMGSGFGFEEQ